MTWPVDHPLLESAAEILRDNRFDVSPRVLDGFEEPLLVAESPYMLAVLIAGERWNDVAGAVGPAEVGLANWASVVDHSSRRWDLYVVVLIEQRPDSASEGAAIERAEANTDMTRKIVRSGIHTDTRERIQAALRPLLPLAPVGRAALPDFAAALEERLRVHGIEAEIAQQAVADFVSGRKVIL